MPRYSKKKYRKYRKFYRRYKKGGYIRSDRVINATPRSSCSIKVKKSILFNTAIGAGDVSTSVVAINPWVQQIYNSALAAHIQNVYRTSTSYTTLFQRYSEMYDEAKVDFFGVKVTVNSALGINGVAPSVKLTTAWDRKGTYADTYYNSKYPSYSDIASLATAKSRNFSNFTTTPFIYDSVRASDFVEKYLWCDSSVDTYSGKARDVNVQLWCNEAWIDANNHFLGFSPTFYFALAFLDFEPTQSVMVTFTVDMYAIYSFRNPRTGQEAVAHISPDAEGGVRGLSDSVLKKAPDVEEPPLKKKKVVGKIVGEIVDPEEIHPDDD